jgi:hypothetical protein
MADRLREALVRSYVGAIALGWILGQATLDCANLLVMPIAQWVLAQRNRSSVLEATRPAISFQALLPELVRAIFLLAVGYFLLRWLYYKPEVQGTPETAPEATRQVEEPSGT